MAPNCRGGLHDGALGRHPPAVLDCRSMLSSDALSTSHPALVGAVVTGRARRRLAGLLGVVAAIGAGTVAGYVTQRRALRRWRADELQMAQAGLVLGDELVHHDVPVSDGGRIHAVEVGEGPPIVLVHGVTLSLETWALQLAGLSDFHRVIAIDQRGHGRSVAGQGEGAFSFERMADDLLEVLEALDVRGGVLVGHSMGGMVAMTAAIEQPDRLARHIGGLVFVATSAAPVAGVGLPPAAIDRVSRIAARRIGRLDRTSGTLLGGEVTSGWTSRFGFGVRPDPAHIELTRTMIGSMSPAALTELTGSISGHDVRAGLAGITMPVRVVVGSRDVLTPPFHAKRLAAAIPGAELDILPGCGHMVMLERPDELGFILRELSATVQLATGADAVDAATGRTETA